jgi:hypothetical protein
MVYLALQWLVSRRPLRTTVKIKGSGHPLGPVPIMPLRLHHRSKRLTLHHDFCSLRPLRIFLQDLVGQILKVFEIGQFPEAAVGQKRAVFG